MKKTHIILFVICLVYGFSYEDLPPYRQLGSFSFKDPFFPDAGNSLHTQLYEINNNWRIR